MISEFDLQLLQRSWQRSFASYKANSPKESRALFENLLEAYSEPQRKYHTLQHLVECIQKFELDL